MGMGAAFGGVLTVRNQGFYVYKLTNQAIGSGGVATLVNWEGTAINISSTFSVAADRHTPVVSGYYRYEAMAWCDISYYLEFRINGSLVASQADTYDNNPAPRSHTALMNGTTDYCEIFISLSGAGNILAGSAGATEKITYFQGFRVY